MNKKTQQFLLKILSILFVAGAVVSYFLTFIKFDTGRSLGCLYAKGWSLILDEYETTTIMQVGSQTLTSKSTISFERCTSSLVQLIALGVALVLIVLGFFANKKISKVLCAFAALAFVAAGVSVLFSANSFIEAQQYGDSAKEYISMGVGVYVSAVCCFLGAGSSLLTLKK